MSSEFVPFGPGSMMWKINRERVVLLAGPAAAVLQVAHPQVAMGVAAHSNFRTDTMGRLHRTLEAVYTVAFGSKEEIEAVRVAIARAHRAVKGKGYSAFDPDAQLWVMATLIMGSVTMYRRFVGNLTETELDQFLQENAIFGGIFGLNPLRLSTRWREFDVYYHEMLNGPALGSHPLCAEVAQAVVAPGSPWYMRALTTVFQALASELIPGPLRERLGLRPTSLPLWSWLDAVLPVLIRFAPSRLRFAPAYNSAVMQRDAEDDGTVKKEHGKPMARLSSFVAPSEPRRLGGREDDPHSF
ncbi:MAG: oxygenase MpaB family protein [Terrimicrobiaceae bacterium]